MSRTTVENIAENAVFIALNCLHSLQKAYGDRNGQTELITGWIIPWAEEAEKEFDKSSIAA